MKPRYIFLISILCGVIYDFSFSQGLPDSTQIKAFEKFNSRNGKWVLRWDQQTGTPAVMYGSKSISYASLENKEQIARQFLKDQSAIFKMKNDLSDLSKLRDLETKDSYVIDFQQYYKNIPIHTAQYSVAVGTDKTVYMAAGKYFKKISCKTTPTITSEQAIEIGIRSIDQNNEVTDYSATNLIIYPKDEEFILSYKVYLDKWELIINALNGDVVNKLNKYGNLTEGHGYVYQDDPIKTPVYNNPVTLPRLYGDGYIHGTYVYLLSNAYMARAYNINNNYYYTPASWGGGAGNNFDEVNVYYHIDKFAYNYWYQKFYVQFPTACSLFVMVNQQGSIQRDEASYVRPYPELTPPNYYAYINFGAGGIRFKNHSLKSDIIYHEYTHLMNWRIGLDRDLAGDGEALTEGYADYHAASFTNDPKIGENLVRNTDTGTLRTLETYPTGVWESNPPVNQRYGWKYSNRNTLKYTYCYNSQSWLNGPGGDYIKGMIWSSALWDLRKILGANTADYLIYQGLVHRHGIITFQDARDGLLIADTHVYNGIFHNTINSIMNAREIPYSGLYKIGAEQEQAVLPSEFDIAQNYPNPFNPTTKISYALPDEGRVTIKIYDSMGREVNTLTDEAQNGGMHSVVWKGKNMHGNEAASGIYFYMIRYEGKSYTKKMMLMR
jgi:Zn-dependent metalloprotease